MKPKHIVIASLTVGALLLLMLDLADEETGSAAETTERGPPQVEGAPSGISSRETDPANLLEPEWVSEAAGTDLATLRSAADEAVNVLAAFDAGLPEWSPTTIQLEDLNWLVEERRECWAGYGKAIETPCNYDLEMVARPTAESKSAEIIYTRPSVMPGSSSACEQLASCISRTRLGQPVPIPEEGYRVDGGLISMAQSLQHSQLSDEMYDPKIISKVVDDQQERLREFEAGQDLSDPKLAHIFETEKRMLTFLQRWKSELNSGP